MGFIEYLRNLRSEEEDAESLSSELKEDIQAGRDGEVLADEEDELISKLLTIEEETARLLSKEVENRERLYQSNKEFIKWFNNSIRAFSEISTPYTILRGNINEVSRTLRSINLNGGKIPLEKFQWNEKILDPGQEILENLKEIEDGRKNVIEDLEDNEEKMVMDKDFINTQKSEISELKQLIDDLKIEENEVIRRLNSNKAEIAEKHNIQEQKVEKIINNLHKIEELERELEEKEEEINAEKNQLTGYQISEFFENKKEVQNQELGKVTNLLRLIDEDGETFYEDLAYLEELGKKDMFRNNETILKQIRVLQKSRKNIREYLETFTEAKDYLYLGEILQEKNQTKQYLKKEGGKHLTRRNFVKALGSIWTIDTSLNILAQKNSGQESFLNPQEIHSSNEHLIENLLENGNAEIFVLDIYFKNQAEINPSEAVEFLEKSLNSLSEVNISIRWIPVFATLEQYYEKNNTTEQELKARGVFNRIKEFNDQFHTIVKEYGIGEEIPEELSKYESTNGQSQLLQENLLVHCMDYVDLPDEVLRNKTVVFTADFKETNLKGVSTYDSYGSGQYALSGRFRSNKDTLNTIAHEIGHKLKLPHTYTQDVMSYSLLADISDKHIRIPFGPESRINWYKVRQNFQQNQ